MASQSWTKRERERDDDDEALAGFSEYRESQCFPSHFAGLDSWAFMS